MIYYIFDKDDRVKFRRTIDPGDKQYLVVSVEGVSQKSVPAGHYQWLTLDNGLVYSSSFFEPA